MLTDTEWIQRRYSQSRSAMEADFRFNSVENTFLTPRLTHDGAVWFLGERNCGVVAIDPPRDGWDEWTVHDANGKCRASCDTRAEAEAELAARVQRAERWWSRGGP